MTSHPLLVVTHFFRSLRLETFDPTEGMLSVNSPTAGAYPGHSTPVPLRAGEWFDARQPALGGIQAVGKSGQGQKTKEFRNLRFCSLARTLLKQLHGRAVVLERVIPMDVCWRHFKRDGRVWKQWNREIVTSRPLHWRCRGEGGGGGGGGIWPWFLPPQPGIWPKIYQKVKWTGVTPGWGEGVGDARSWYWLLHYAIISIAPSILHN